MINWFQVITMAVVTPMILFWLFLYVKYQHTFDAYTKSLSSKEYNMPEIFFIGMGFMNLIHYDIHTRKGRMRIKEISEIKGKKYAEYYYYIIKGAMFAYILTFVPVAALVGVLTNSPWMLLLGGALVVLLIDYLQKDIDNSLERRREDMLLDLPQVLSKMALLVNSGMVMREAWVKVSENGDRALYQEMRTASAEIANGASDMEAFRNFADRCSMKQVRKMVSMLLQNMEKGNEELSYFMTEMSHEMWEEKKSLVRQKGETAGTKLMLPMGLIFIGILILIVVPVCLDGMATF